MNIKDLNFKIKITCVCVKNKEKATKIFIVILYFVKFYILIIF